MARRTEPPAPNLPANLTGQTARGAIQKLERRLADFGQADPSQQGVEPWHLAEGLCNKLAATVADIFGRDTLEAIRLKLYPSSFTPGVMGDVSRSQEMNAFENGRQRAISLIRAELDILRERSQDNDEDSAGRALRAYEGLELHPIVHDAAGQLFVDGHYPNAIEDAIKALNNYVRLKSGAEGDGVKLMEYVFSPSNPVLKFNELGDDSDREEQKGFMQLFSGAVSGLRNPRAHKLIRDDPERALEFIAFVSLLAKLVDGSTKNRKA